MSAYESPTILEKGSKPVDVTKYRRGFVTTRESDWFCYTIFKCKKCDTFFTFEPNSGAYLADEGRLFIHCPNPQCNKQQYHSNGLHGQFDRWLHTKLLRKKSKVNDSYD